MLRLVFVLLFGISIRWCASVAFAQSTRVGLKDCPDSVLDRCQHYIQRGDYRGAQTILEKALIDAPSNPDLQEMMGDVYGCLQDSDRAVQAFTRALMHDPRRSSAYEKRGYEYSLRSDWDLAVADYSKAIQINPNSRCYYNRATAYRALTQYYKARSDLKRAYDGGLVSPSAYFLATLLATCPDATVRDGPRAIEYARAACEQTKFKDYPSLSMLAAAHAEAGEWGEAIRQSKKALELAKGRERATERLNLELYHFHERLRIITPQLIAKNRPSTAGEALLYALIEKGTGNRLAAIANLRRAIELNPRLSSAHFELGSLTSQENLGESINHFNRCLEVNPKNVEALIGRGTAHLYLGKYRDALRDTEAAMILDPKVYGAFAVNLCATAACGEADRVLRELAKWSQEHPNLPVNAIRGHCYLFQGRFNEAVAELTEALRRNPGDRLSYPNRAVALSALGKQNEANQDLEACVRLDPSFRAPTKERMRAAQRKACGK